MRALRLWAATAAIGAGLCVGTALADGPPPSYPPGYTPEFVPNLTYDWTGIYVGGHVGGANTRSAWAYTNGLLVEPLTQVANGLAGGGHVGLQKQWGSLVLGAEATYTWMDQEATQASADGVTSLASTQKSLLLVTGKVGAAWDNILAYAKGGYAAADVDYRTTAIGTGVLLTRSSRQEQGWTAGVGLEYAVWNHVILGVEYDYVRFSPGDRVQTVVTGPAGTTVSGSGIDTQAVTARLSFKLGGGRP